MNPPPPAGTAPGPLGPAQSTPTVRTTGAGTDGAAEAEPAAPAAPAAPINDSTMVPAATRTDRVDDAAWTERVWSGTAASVEGRGIDMTSGPQSAQ